MSNKIHSKAFKTKQDYTTFIKEKKIKLIGVWIATETDCKNNPDEDFIAGESMFISYKKTDDVPHSGTSDNYGNRGNFGKFGY